MAYNYFPAGYQPYQFQNNQSQNNGILWVQGEGAAKSYPVAPNQTVVLFDSEQNTIYLKSADASGMPSVKMLDYTIREDSFQKREIASTEKFATKEDVSKEIKRLEEMIREITTSSCEQAE